MRPYAKFAVILTALLALTAALVTDGARAHLPRPRGRRRNNQPVRVLVPMLKRGEKSIIERLRALQFQVTVVPWPQLGPGSLRDVDVVLLPTQWGDQTDHTAHLERLSASLHRFIQAGGGLLVCQPNPEKTNLITPALLPYPITFQNTYDAKKPERVNLAPRHFITRGLKDAELPFPADPMLKVDPRYQVLARQKSTGWSSLAVCSFGDGRVVVQTASESRGATIPLGNEIVRRMVIWAASRDPE